MAKSLYVWGLSHKTAPLRYREQLEIPADRVLELLADLREKGGALEAAVLSTCNRVEVYFCAENGAGRVVKLVETRLSAAKGIKPSSLRGMTYLHEDAEVAKHLFAVAGGLDSLVLGEPQILGQVKDAYHRARSAASLGPFLSGLFEKALHAGKRIRSETQIGDRPVSVSFMAVALARKVFGNLEGKTALVVGAGETGRETLVHLKTQGLGRIWVANRSPKAAEKAAQEAGGEALTLAEVAEKLREADIVISATGSPKPILVEGEVRAVAQSRRGRPLLLIDIAVPRDIEAGAGNVENVYLYNIDDLKTMVEESLESRRRELPRAQLIVEEEAAAFGQKADEAGLTPVIVDLRRRVAGIEAAELDKAARRLGWDETRRKEAEALLRAVSAKVLHEPTVRLKSLAGKPEGAHAADWIRRLFGLA